MTSGASTDPAGRVEEVPVVKEEGHPNRRLDCRIKKHAHEFHYEHILQSLVCVRVFVARGAQQNRVLLSTRCGNNLTLVLRVGGFGFFYRRFLSSFLEPFFCSHCCLSPITINCQPLGEWHLDGQELRSCRTANCIVWKSVQSWMRRNTPS